MIDQRVRLAMRSFGDWSVRVGIPGLFGRLDRIVLGQRGSDVLFGRYPKVDLHLEEMAETVDLV